MLDYERSVNERISTLLIQFPAVAILGARQVGKSYLLKHYYSGYAYYDLEYAPTMEIIKSDVSFFLDQLTGPTIFDEAQLLPELFSALRVYLDNLDGKKGQVILSGSSSPELIRSISESLAGRVAIIELGTLMLNEVQHNDLSQFFSLMYSKEYEKLRQLEPRSPFATILHHVLLGGYPDVNLNQDNNDFKLEWFNSYIQTYINRDIRSLFPKLSLENYQSFIKMLSVSSGNMINKADFARSIGASEPTISDYFRIAEGSFLWRSLPGYTVNERKRLRKMPKGYIRDSGLCCYFRNIFTPDDLRFHPNFGAIWESYVIEQLLNGFKQFPGKVDAYHYRTQNGAEVDLILQTTFGLIPIEIKSGKTISKRNIQGLIGFMNDYNCDVGIVFYSGEEVVEFLPNVYLIPVGSL